MPNPSVFGIPEAGMEKKAHPHHHHYNECDELDPLIQEMQRSQLRVTEQRKAILHALVEHHGPFTAEEIHKIITSESAIWRPSTAA